MSTMIINSITIVFLVLTIAYSIINILSNRSLYRFIKEDYDKLSNDYNRSVLYINIKEKYNRYVVENPYCDINVTSFIEEVCTDFTFRKKSILDRIRVIKNSSGTCILLGVLGTFIGLSIMLSNINAGDIINSLPRAISSMQTAFITSICGIICSILINLFIGYKDCEHVLVQLMLKLENLLTSEVTHIKSLELDNKVEDVKNTIKQISKSIESIERFDQISKDLNDFNDEFISGIEVLKDLLDGSHSSIQSFEQNVRKLDKQFSIMNIKFTRLFDKYDNQEDINKEILKDIKETSRNINESTESQQRVKEYIRNVNASFGLYERNVQDLLSKLVAQENNIHNKQEELSMNEKDLNQTVNSLSHIVDKSSKDITEKLELLFSYIDIYKEILDISAKNSVNFEESERVYERVSERVSVKNKIYDDRIHVDDIEIDEEIYDLEEVYELEELENQKLLELNGDDSKND